MAEYDSVLFTMQQLIAGYGSLYTEEQAKVCPLLNGNLNFLEDKEVQVTFTSGEIRDESLDITAKYVLIRYENGYQIYNIIFDVIELEIDAAGSEQLFYNVELPTHFNYTPYNSVSYGRDAYGECVPTFDYDSTHLTDYVPSITLYPIRTGFTSTSGKVIIRMEGF